MSEERNVHSRRVGLKDIYVALVTKNDATGYTAGAPTYTAIINALSIAFGEQFTPEELAESDTDVADVIVAYMAVDLNLAQRIEQKIDAMTANFKTGS